MKQWVCCIGIVLVTISCRTIKDRDLDPGARNDLLLPPLEIRVDLPSFHFLSLMPYLRKPETQFRETMHIDSAIYISSLVRLHRAVDIATMFEREVQQNITTTFGEKQGYIICTLVDGEVNQKFGWTILSGFTLMIPNLFGMPIAKVKARLDVQVEIYDRQQNRIATYMAPCTGRAWVALYYGYGERPTLRESPVFRKANINAFRCAMEDIKQQIAADYDQLRYQLY